MVTRAEVSNWAHFSITSNWMDFQTNTTRAVQLGEMFMVIIRVKVSELQAFYVKYEHIQGYNDDNLLSDFFIFCSHSFLIAGN